MELAQIGELIRDNIINGEYSLVNNDLDLGKVFGEQVPIIRDITLKDVDLKLELPSLIYLAGTANILDFGDVSLEITFESKKVQVKPEVTDSETPDSSESASEPQAATTPTPAPPTSTTPPPAPTSPPPTSTSPPPAPTSPPSTSTSEPPATQTSEPQEKEGEEQKTEEKTIRTYKFHVMLPPGKLGNLLYSLAYEVIKGIPIPEELPLPNIDFSDFSLSVTPATKEYRIEVKSLTDWVFNVGSHGLTVSDVNFTLARDSKGKTKGTFSGGIAIGDVTIDIDCIIPGKFELKTVIPTLNFSSLLQDLCGVLSVSDASLPNSILDLDINNLNLSLIIEKGEFKFNISGESKFGKVQFVITKKDGKWNFIVGFSPPESFKFSEINEALIALDDLKLPNTALILSSTEIESSEISTINIGRDVTLKKGVNLFATFDLTSTGINKLIGLETLGLTGQIGIKPFSLLLAISLEGKINIADFLELRGFYFEIAVPPLSLAFKSKIALQIASDLLLITLAAKFSLADTTLSLAGTMEGAWNEPFGFKGVTIEDVAIELGLNLSTTPIPLPVIGVAGSLKVGDFIGSGAVKYNPTNPAQSMLLIKFNELYLIDIVNIFCPFQLSSGFSKILESIGFRDVDIYIVPSKMNIGELEYEQGFRISGKMQFLDWNAEFNLRLDYNNGFKIYAKLDPIEIPGILVFKGAGDSPNPIIDIAYIQGEDPYFYVSGFLKILGGISVEANINYDENGFQFLIENKIFDLWSATLLVEGENLKNAATYRIRAIIHNDILDTIRKGLIEAVNFIANTADAAYNTLLKGVNVAQAEVDNVGRQIQEFLEGARDAVASKIKVAESDVREKREAIEKAQAEIDAMKAQIRAEIEAAQRKLNDAISALESAQNVINGIDSQINSKKARIAQLNQEISYYWNLYNNTSKWRVVKRAGYLWEIGIREAEKTLLYGQIGALELARIVPWGVLEGCQWALGLAREALKNVPVEDITLAPLVLVKEAVELALLGAEKYLDELRTALENIPIDETLRKLEAAAKETLAAAESALKEFQDGTNFILDKAKDLINKGFDLSFNIKRVWFDTTLSAPAAMIIDLIFEIEFLGNSHKIMFNFDFNDIPGSLKRLGKQIITGEFKAPTQEDIIDIDTIVIQKRTLELPPVPGASAVVPLLEANPPPIIQPPLLTGPIMIPEQTLPETQIIESPISTEPQTSIEFQVSDPWETIESQVTEPTAPIESQETEPPIDTQSPLFTQSITIEESFIDEEPIIIEEIVVIEAKEEDPQAGKIYKSISSDLEDLLIKGKKGADKLLNKGEKAVNTLLDKGQNVFKDFIEDGIDDLLDLDSSSKKKKKNKKKR